MTRFLSICPIALIVLVIVPTFSNCSVSENKLLNALLGSYNNLERPVSNHSDPLLISFGVSVMQIIYVDEQFAQIKTNLWLTLEWIDVNLRWDPNEYENISDIRIPPHRIWKPDILTYNSIDEQFDGTFPTNVVVRSNGSVTYIPPGIFRTTCRMSFQSYPFDEQKCEIKFGSWTYDGGQLDIVLGSSGGADVSSFAPSYEWGLIGATLNRNAIFYACCPHPYVDVTLVLHIQRRGDSILYRCKIVNIFICFMVLMSFVMSPESGQKLVIGIGTMICNVWFISSTSTVLPANHNCEMITYFQRLSALVFSSIIANAFTVYLHFRIFKMPDLLRRIFIEKIPSLLWFICPQRVNMANPMKTELVGSLTHPEGTITAGTENHDNIATHRTSNTNDDTQTLIAEIDNLKRTVSSQAEFASCMNDWKYLASIVDRFFLFIYVICILIFVTLLFPSLFPSF